MAAPALSWSCSKPIGSSCPADPAVPPWEDIQLIDCMSANCPFLQLDGYRRIQEGEGG